MKRLSDAFAALAALAVAAVASGQCPIRNYGLSGGFDFTHSLYEGGTALCTGGGPPLRDQSGRTLLNDRCAENLLNGSRDLGLAATDAGLWYAVHLDECSFTTDLELSFADSALQGTLDHRGLFAAVRLPSPCGNGEIDLDAIDNGFGAAGNVVPVVAIPPPRLVSEFAAPTSNPALFTTRVYFPEIPWYSSPWGNRPRIAGYRVYYSDLPPTTGDPAGYAGQATVPSIPSGVIPPGVWTDITFAGHPWMFEFVSLAAQVVYEEVTGLSSQVTSSDVLISLTDFAYPQPTVAVALEMTPPEVAAGDTVTLRLTVEGVRGSPGTPLHLPAWVNLKQELLPGCLDLASGRNLQCPDCTAASYDPITGKLRAERVDPAFWGRFALTIDFTAAAAGGDCAATAWATVDRGPYVNSRAHLLNHGTQVALRRETGTGPLSGRFPLPIYLDPAPPLPFTDQPGLLGDDTRPFVLYQYTRPGNIYLTKDLVSDSVVLVR